MKIKKVIFEDKSKKVMSRELENEKKIKDTNVPDDTDKMVSVVKTIAEAQDENIEVPTEISSDAEEVEVEGEDCIQVVLLHLTL